MRHAWKILLILAAAGLPAAPAFAGMPYPQKMKCPIGGKDFTHTTTMSYSIFGYRPDGKPYGSWEFPMELPRCPDNGLVLFGEFAKADLDRLKPLVETAEYKAMLAQETNYYLAAWLMERLGRPAIDVAWVTLQASWQADGRPELKKRYQALYVDRIRKLERSGDGVDWLIMQGRAVNGLRELGRFDEAKALLATLDLKPLDVVVPAEKYGASTTSGLGREVLNQEEIDEAERKRGFFDYFGQMRELVDARDSSSEPIRAIPLNIAAGRCRDRAAELSADEKAYCASDEMKKFLAGD